jgi:hypothetical protein
MNDFLSTITTGVIDSLVFATLVYFFQMHRYRQHLKNKFDNQTFQSFYKEVPGDRVQTIKLTVKQNVLHFKGTRTSDDEPFEGELIMNPINLKIGEGFQYHKNSEGYGFIKVIIKDENTIFIESPYIKVRAEDKFGTTIQQAFIWKRKK